MTAVHAYDHLLSCAKAVQPLVDQIMEAPVNAAKLQVELDRLSAEIASARQTLAAERASWQIEWKSLRDASDHAATQRELETADWEAKLSEKQEELQRVRKLHRGRNETIGEVGGVVSQVRPDGCPALCWCGWFAVGGG